MILNIPGPLPIVKVQAVVAAGDRVVLTVVHAAPTPYAAAYLVDPDGTINFIGRSESLGKDDSASSVIYSDGSVGMFVSEADPGGSGSTCKIHTYIFLDIIPPVSSTIDSFARSEIAAVKAGLVQAGS